MGIFKYIIFLGFFLALYACKGQSCIIIKHTGLSDATIQPIIFSDKKPNQEFANQYLTFMKNSTYKLNFIRFVKVDNDELEKLNHLLFEMVNSINDTATFEYKKGSFDFMYIKEGELLKSIPINDRENSIQILNNFLLKLDENLTCYDRAYEEILYIIREFEPNPTKEIVK